MIVSPLDNPTIFLAHPQLLQPKFQQRSSDLFRGFADDPCHLRRAVRACHCEASWFLGWWNKRHSMQVTLQWYTSNTTEVNYHTCRLLWYHYIVHIPDMEHMGPRKKPIKPNYMYTYIYIYYVCEQWDFAGDFRPRLTPSSSCLWFQVSEQSERLWYHPPSGNQTGQLKIHHSWMIFPFKPPFIGGFQVWRLITRGYHVLSSPRFSNSMATKMSNTCDAPHTQCPFHDLWSVHVQNIPKLCSDSCGFVKK